MLRTFLLFILIGALGSLLSGCESLRFPGVYRIDIGQGNILTQEMVEKLRVGMTPRQVQFVMGSPMIEDPFNPDRWDYLYKLDTGKGFRIENRLTLYFENERLARIDENLFKNPEQLRNKLLKDMGLPIPQTPETVDETTAEPSEPLPTEI